MPRLFNPGKPDTDDAGQAMGRYPLVKHRFVHDKPEVWAVKVPDTISAGAFVEHKEGAAYLSIFGHGFVQIEREKWWDVPPGVDPAAMKRACPWLLTEAEHEELAAKAADNSKTTAAKAAARS